MSLVDVGLNTTQRGYNRGNPQEAATIYNTNWIMREPEVVTIK